MGAWWYDQTTAQYVFEHDDGTLQYVSEQAARSMNSGVFSSQPAQYPGSGPGPITFRGATFGHRSNKEEPRMIGLDFETKARRDLTVVGLPNYIECPDFGPLIAAVVEPSGYSKVYDFVLGGRQAWEEFLTYLNRMRQIAAHNASFERAVLKYMNLPDVDERIVDSAVIARAVGAGSKLAHAAPQLLGDVKMEVGSRLIRKFSIPQKDGTFLVDTMKADGTLADDSDWALFKTYCLLDAKLSLNIVENYGHLVPQKEQKYDLITQRMNDAGWPVDMDAVQEMQRRYLENIEAAVVRFQSKYPADKDLNFNSGPQLKAFCVVRGFRAQSFDEEHVTRYLELLRAKVGDYNTPDEKRYKYLECIDLLETKQIIGGSSLKKLRVILDTTSADNRLKGQYMHIGAGQSYRTTGRGAQMQNLVRLHNERDMDELDDEDSEWTNAEMAENLRQVFTASDPTGDLLVGDFKSVEARGLAYIAGEERSLNGFRSGQDPYIVQARAIFNLGSGDAVSKDQRQAGKVGVLACGYGAGPPAVVAFAKGMHITITDDESAMIVSKFRSVNPNIMALWALLDEGIHAVVDGGHMHWNHEVAYGMHVEFNHIPTPETLRKQHPGAQSVEMSLFQEGSTSPYLRRVFHGCYLRGRNVCYYRPFPAEGKYWKAWKLNPKTKEREFYSLYGGKLAGILTQSFCREIFFDVLANVQQWVDQHDELTLIGQFHDEIVLDYVPESRGFGISKMQAMADFENLMSSTNLRGFPLEADIKSDYRYTK